MKQFIEKQNSILCTTKEQVVKFLEICEDNDLQWASGCKPTDFIPDVYPIIFTYNYKGRKGLSFSSIRGVFHGSLLEFQSFIEKSNFEEMLILFDFIFSRFKIDFYHLKHSRYYIVSIGDLDVFVTRERYYELQKVVTHLKFVEVKKNEKNI